MRLTIAHRTEYGYEQPLAYALQRLRLAPASGPMQTVHSWSLAIDGAREEARFTDHFGNDTRLISIGGEPHGISVEATGEVETVNKAGVTGPHRGFAPLWLFARETPLTMPGDGIKALAASVASGDKLAVLHELMAAIGERIASAPAGPAEGETVAEDALSRGSGVCHDHAHVFIAGARLIGLPARYVSGYLMVDAAAGQAVSHAWAEAHVQSLGWVGFDVANGISPDDSYVRIASGRDHRDAVAVSGLRLGQPSEQIAISISAEQ